MPKGENLARVATRETRAKGGYARAAAIARRKAEAAERVEREFQARLDRLLERYDELLNVEDVATALRAVLAGFDRVAGKPMQPTELTGSVDHTHHADEARRYLAAELARRATGSGTNGDPGGDAG